VAAAELWSLPAGSCCGGGSGLYIFIKVVLYSMVVWWQTIDDGGLQRHWTCSGNVVLLSWALAAWGLVEAALRSRDGNDGWQPMFGTSNNEARVGGWGP
jgi:hypothetical protein